MKGPPLRIRNVFEVAPANANPQMSIFSLRFLFVLCGDGRWRKLPEVFLPVPSDGEGQRRPLPRRNAPRAVMSIPIIPPIIMVSPRV